MPPTHTFFYIPQQQSGVYLKANEEAVAALGLPPPEHDLGLRFVETQLAAVPEDPGGCHSIAPACCASVCVAVSVCGCECVWL